MRVLHMVPDIGMSNGMMSVILNYANAMPDDIQFDVVYLMDNPKDRKRDIETLGGKVYKLGTGPIDVLKFKFFGFFNNHKNVWDAVHIHMPYFSAFIVPAARWAGIKKICCHCHSTLFSLNPKNVKINQILNIPTKFIVDKKFACSKSAGDYWYGKNYTVLKNAVDCRKYRYNETIRNRVRSVNNWNNSLIVGHIGRTDIIQKNHSFLFEIFSHIHARIPNAKLLLIGGEKFDSLIQICEKLGIEKEVYFLGSRNDVDELLQAVDVFVFPSTNEGLPVSVIEAQAAGLPVLMSDTITDEVLVSEEIFSLPLNENAKIWADKVLEISQLERKDNFEIMESSGWNIYDSAKKLIAYYRG